MTYYHIYLEVGEIKKVELEPFKETEKGFWFKHPFEDRDMWLSKTTSKNKFAYNSLFTAKEYFEPTLEKYIDSISDSMYHSKNNRDKVNTIKKLVLDFHNLK